MRKFTHNKIIIHDDSMGGRVHSIFPGPRSAATATGRAVYAHDCSLQATCTYHQTMHVTKGASPTTSYSTRPYLAVCESSYFLTLPVDLCRITIRGIYNSGFNFNHEY